MVQRLPPEERLRGLSPEQIAAALTPEQLAAALTPEQIAALTEHRRQAPSLSPKKKPKPKK